ncbi:hypothetical protein [Umezawaea sp. NPDC059074]|uniref:hypothetical protein n=1 Tax=Umezawaea sp. NPDC059074 TaxID=3346716 RepID=UPI0036786FC9
MEFKGMLRRVVGVGAALAAAGTMLMAPATAGAAPSSVAADPSTSWDLVYGATKASGTIRWHQRSADVDYTLKASYCRRLWATPYDANYKEYPSRSTGLRCDDTSSNTLNLVVNIPGGPAHVTLCLQNEDGNRLVCEQYDRP